MDTNSLFAVVDIETTGTDQEHDKIIQFACVFIENSQIVNQFSIDINPLRSIPKTISLLTGITNSDVTQAPYFEDVGFTIRQMLDGCVFVAHNVFFDFNFLNSELVRAGIEPLTLECIDTVELFQAIYPTSNGFRVSDMASELQILHENPHEALSDAYVTANGLIKMMERLNTYPLVTLESLTDLSKHMSVDNHLFFEMVLNKNKQVKNRQLNKGIKIVDGLALKEKDYSFLNTKEFFKEDSNKNLLRPTQQVMVDNIEVFLQDDKAKNLLIEAETGIGKTMGYIYPFTSKKYNKPVLISTSTIMLQEQFVSKDIPFFNDLMKAQAIAVLRKSQRHYIYLDAFKVGLINEYGNEQKHYVITQMAILSWLLITTTGDLDEINVNKTNIIYKHIAHPGSHVMSKKSSFYEEDFYLYLDKKCQHADFIVVNHAFLLSDQFRIKKQLPSSDYVVVDEAHRLPQMAEETAMIRFSFNNTNFLIKSLLSYWEVSEKSSEVSLNHLVDLANNILNELRENLEWLEFSLMQFFKVSETKQDTIMNLDDYLTQISFAKKNMSETNLLFKELIVLKQSIKESVYRGSAINLIDYLSRLEELVLLGDSFMSIFTFSNKGEVKWFNQHKSHLNVLMVNMQETMLSDHDWYKQAKKIVYTSGTLQLDKDSHYFEDRLKLEHVKSIKLPSLYHYDKQSRFYVVRHPQFQAVHDTKDFAKRISQIVKKVYKTQEKNILILFTNHKLLQATFRQLNDYYANTQVQVLAQGITGTKEKIIKKVNQGEHSIILGATSFWEGVDFESDLVDIVMMTKIPFDPPNRPFVQARYQMLEEQGLNPFKVDALPLAGLRLRQGLGRLLRSPQDKGVVMMLDERFMTSDYHKALLSYLPESLSVDYLPMKDILEDMTAFFDDRSTIN